MCVCACRWDMMVFFMCHCLAWFIADYVQLTGVQVRTFHQDNLLVVKNWKCLFVVFLSSLYVSVFWWAGRAAELLQAGLCGGVVHPRVHGGADLPFGALGSHHQLADRPVPAPMRRHCRGDPGRLARRRRETRVYFFMTIYVHFGANVNEEAAGWQRSPAALPVSVESL